MAASGQVVGHVGCGDKERQETIQGNTKFCGGRTTHQFHYFIHP